MSESPTKKQKTKEYFKNQAKFKNKSYNSKNQHQKFLEAGMQGYFLTTNFRTSDGVREAYMILNKYYDKSNSSDPEEKKEAEKQENNDDDDDDIANQLQNQIEKTKQETKEKSFNFQAVKTGTDSCIFIKSTVENHKDLAIQFVKDTFETKSTITKSLVRFFPIDIVCRANMKDIVDASGQLFDKYFLKEPTEYSIIFNKRYNNDINRDEVIKQLADLIGLKNKDNKVNLKFPKMSVIVEVIKGLCCVAVLPNYLLWKKYNIVELSTEKSEEAAQGGKKESKVEKNDGNGEAGAESQQKTDENDMKVEDESKT